MATVEVDVAKALKALKRYRSDALQEVKNANFEAAVMVEKRAKEIVPVQSGKLQKSIRASSTVGVGVVKAGGARVPYANPIHWGWNRPVRKWSKGRIGGGPIAATKFLTRAADDEMANIRRMYQDVLADLSRRFGR